MPMPVDVTLPEKNDKGKYPLFAFPGGYLIVYYTCDGEDMCGECANEEHYFDFDKPVGFVLDEENNYEYSQCCHCNRLLDPARREKCT